MRAFTRLLAPDGRRYELVSGDVIGRHAASALPLDDARVSEAHAMVSLREQELRLIALRGAFAIDGRPVDSVALQPGLVVHLAPQLALEVEAVELPDSVMALEGPGVPRQVLPGVCSVVAGPPLRVQKGLSSAGLAVIWNTGPGWRVREGGGEARDLVVGMQVAGLTAVAAPLAAAGLAATVRRDSVSPPLELVVWPDSVHVHREGKPAVTISGILARILAELVAFDGPVHWKVLAGELWPKGDDQEVLRARLDVNLSRLRRRLRKHGVRVDLVRSDGAGQIGLLLYPHDRVEERD